MPTSTCASELTTPPVLVSTQEWTKVARRPTEESIQIEHDYDDNEWPYDFNDDDGFTPIPRDMFEMNPPTLPPAQITTVLSPVPTKVQPTKPIPTRMTNKYAIFTSDDEDNISIIENDEGIQRTGNVKRAPETGITQTTIIQMMTTTGENSDDAGVDDADALYVTVTPNLQNKDTMNEVYTTALDLGVGFGIIGQQQQEYARLRYVR